MRVPRRHRFATRETTSELFRRLPRDRRFRWAPAGGASTFGCAPVLVREGGSASFASELGESVPRVPLAAPGGSFPGGWIGFVSYERGYPLVGLEPESAARAGAPHSWFGLYDTFARHDPARGEVEVVSWGWTHGDHFDARLALDRAEALEESLRHARGAPPEPFDAGEPRASLTEPEHAARVREILHAIRRGDIYQANLTVRFDVDCTGDGVPLFERLVAENPAPYAAFLEAGSHTIISCSPERLLRARGRHVESRPIKGTARRSTDPAEDDRLASELVASAKDRAELLMITDLVRNDLGKVCDYGTIHVPHLVQLESFPHVHHLVSTVRGRLRRDADVFTALEALFPFGSITGAPKRRAMEILRELETRPRGVYTGTVGWVGFDRSADFNVAIRTGQLVDGVFSFGAGGGIVADSEPRAEWEELLLKAKAFTLALRGARDAPREVAT